MKRTIAAVLMMFLGFGVVSHSFGAEVKTLQEKTIINVLEGIPYQEQQMGKRKLVDEKHLLIMQLALKPGQSVPQHTANSNVHILVVRGEVVINLNGTETIAKEGSLVPVAHKTIMSVVNKSNKDASFINIKTPNPSEIK